MIIDVHTHHYHTPNAVINVELDEFDPAEDEYYSLGIHPWNASNPNAQDQFNKISEIANSNDQVVAIGETGLDTLSEASLEDQMHLMEQHIVLSEECRKPLVIHSVRRSSEIIQLHKKYNPSQPWIIHGFRGNANIAIALIKERIYLSIGEKFNAKAVNIIPKDLLLVETDESNLSIDDICSRIALYRVTTAEEIKKIAGENASTCFNL